MAVLARMKPHDAALTLWALAVNDRGSESRWAEAGGGETLSKVFRARHGILDVGCMLLMSQVSGSVR